MLEGSLEQARVRLQELLREVVRLPQVTAPVAAELEQSFTVLLTYAHFADYRRRELTELCQELDRL
jgi:hypothetical protein